MAKSEVKAAINRRVEQMCRNPVISEHLVVSTAVLVRLLANTARQEGLLAAVELHRRLITGEGALTVEQEVVDCIGFGTFKNICSHWLGTMEYELVDDVMYDTVKKFGFKASAISQQAKGSELLSAHSLLAGRTLTLN